MAFLKNRTPVIIVGGLILLALLGIFATFTNNPSAFLQNILVIALVGLVIFFLVRRFSNSSPQKKEQRAFLKAAKQSKKRLQHKGKDSGIKSSSLGTLSSLKKSNRIKKKSPAHLTVIDGKKGKKKNRASL
ncbi:SA1362 family protein [Bacillus salipaludis]|uniref:SA1362 family protein n=1 Tax=Bacillus salipaludis TaxID=2547811 RepID=A0AA90TEI0_9BACI|nr:SA1362 family protein [Bacillus salipaludis]MDQ6599622.1 SA1362 family protein [Bacillus salipaludis]